MKAFKIVLFLVVAVGLIAGGMYYNKKSDQKAQEELEKSREQAQTSIQNQMDNLITKDVTVGSGEEAKAGDKVTVNYVGTLENGTEFDNSYKRGTPFQFTVGAGEVIKGWDLGVAGMKVGGKRTLSIPPELGYGANQVGPIPANSTLNFTVELLSISK
jgi:FKBP-type peptidyl-prolyl cis-trans isomerase